MTLRVGINGFGRIGKCIFKILRDRGIEVPLVNDPFLDLEYMHYLLKYDSTYGREDVCQLENDKIIYKGKPTSHSTAKLPSEIPWKDFKVDYVIESTGLFLTLKDCEGHKDVKSIIITAPSPDAPMFVFGVNHLKYNKEKIISNASCTTNCLAPLANILNKNFGIEEGLMMTVHSVTATQKIVDGITKKNKRDGRSGMQNIIPASTGAAKAVTKVLPELEEISEIFEKESKENKEIIGITYDEVVSTDFNKDSRSCILDARGSMELNPKFFKLLAWYDNEYGYSCRTVDLLEYVSKQ
ncbi:Glyceraldehyde-3-phosphate dehydrogenase 2, partial [Nosema bombycis CQ1]